MKITIDRSTVEQELEALEAYATHRGLPGPCPVRDVEYALRAALAEPVQEPVAGAVLGPLPEPAQPAQSAGYMPGCPIEIPETPDYYTAEQMREYAMQALAEPVQEPVAWRYSVQPQVLGASYWAFSETKDVPDAQPLFTAPPQRPAESVQEPVAWYCKEGLKRGVSLKQESPEWIPLYTKEKP